MARKKIVNGEIIELTPEEENEVAAREAEWAATGAVADMKVRMLDDLERRVMRSIIKRYLRDHDTALATAVQNLRDQINNATTVAEARAIDISTLPDSG